MRLIFLKKGLENYRINQVELIFETLDPSHPKLKKQNK